MATVLSFRPTRRALRLLSSRSTATPPAVPQSPAQGAPKPEPATAPFPCEVVHLEDRRLPGVFPWCPPMPPYIGVLVVSAALATSAAAHLAAELSLLPGRITVAAFSPWSA